MKKFLLSILTLSILFSCSTSNNFNKQKHTNFNNNQKRSTKKVEDVSELLKKEQPKSPEEYVNQIIESKPLTHSIENRREVDIFVDRILNQEKENVIPQTISENGTHFYKQIEDSESTKETFLTKTQTEEPTPESRIPKLRKALKISLFAALGAGVALLILFLLSLDVALVMAFVFGILALIALLLLIQIPIWRKIEKLESEDTGQNKKLIRRQKLFALLAAIAPFVLAALGLLVAVVVLF